MKLNYIDKIKANITIHSNKKTTNLLDGTYKSVYKGKSMNFENLREYTIDDDIKDIDWKSSARSGSLLVKQFIAEKKHNVMLVMDTGKKMDADTDAHESKREVALYTAGTIGYLAIKNNDYVGMTFVKDNKCDYNPFKYNLYNLEEYLCKYEKCATEYDADINDLLEFVYKNISKRMIIFIITDMKGLDNIKGNLLKKLRQRHDCMIVNINDNYMFGEDLFDVETHGYIPNFFLRDDKLKRTEEKVKKELKLRNLRKLKKNNINMTSISSRFEINTQIIKLLEEYKYASNN